MRLQRSCYGLTTSIFWRHAPFRFCGRIARPNAVAAPLDWLRVCARNNWGSWMLIVAFVLQEVDTYCDVENLMTSGLHRMARYDLAVLLFVWFMHCSPKRWCVLLRQRRPPVVGGFCLPRHRWWDWESGSFLEQEPIFLRLVLEWVLARHPEPSRIVGLGTSFYSQGEHWPINTDGFTPQLLMIKNKG